MSRGLVHGVAAMAVLGLLASVADAQSPPSAKSKRRSFTAPHQPGLQNEAGLKIQKFAPNQPGLQNAGGLSIDSAEGEQKFQMVVPEQPGLQNTSPFASLTPQDGSAFGTASRFRDPPPAMTFSGQSILVTCSSKMTHGVSCTLRSATFARTYFLQPGESLRFRETRPWAIEFDRGGEIGSTRYRLAPGQFTFRTTTRGWELFRRVQ